MAVNFSVSPGRVESKAETGWGAERDYVASSSDKAPAGASPGQISHAAFISSTQFENKIQLEMGRKRLPPSLLQVPEIHATSAFSSGSLPAEQATQFSSFNHFSHYFLFSVLVVSYFFTSVTQSLGYTFFLSFALEKQN